LTNNIITAGVDEVGRGCLAGPVVSSAVILSKKINLKIIKDSKKINFKNRLKIADYIKQNSYFAIGVASVEEIFHLNILQASLLSMNRAIKKLPKKPQLILIDGTFAPKGLKNYRTIIKGDEKIKCISAASIVAKTYRDLLMIKLSKRFKYYAWERNYGYGTRSHMEGLKKFGITPHHRKGFKPVHKMLSK
jgi:ribonuclease HII